MLKPHHRMMQAAYLRLSRFTRGMTLGVRAMLVRDGQIVLVRHSYFPGWHLPGGGVEAGESFYDALVREIDEEAGAALTGAAELYGVYRNQAASSRDHVAFYVCRAWEQPRELRLPNREIVDVRSFAIDSLPPDASPGTLRRIAEVTSGAPAAIDW